MKTKPNITTGGYILLSVFKRILTLVTNALKKNKQNYNYSLQNTKSIGFGDALEWRIFVLFSIGFGVGLSFPLPNADRGATLQSTVRNRPSLPRPGDAPRSGKRIPPGGSLTVSVRAADQTTLWGEIMMFKNRTIWCRLTARCVSRKDVPWPKPSCPLCLGSSAIVWTRRIASASQRDTLRINRHFKSSCGCAREFIVARPYRSWKQIFKINPLSFASLVDHSGKRNVLPCCLLSALSHASNARTLPTIWPNYGKMGVSWRKFRTKGKKRINVK